MKQVIHSETLAEKLIAAGTMPDNCRRMIIDIQMDNIVVVYTECYGDERLLEIDWAEGLSPEIKEVPAMPSQFREDHNICPKGELNEQKT